ncbi:MAG: hypothetical protein IJ721_02870 [Bacteroidales bacterium]|nr:hypothetical protein [Bacteroidales bacterium]
MKRVLTILPLLLAMLPALGKTRSLDAGALTFRVEEDGGRGWFEAEGVDPGNALPGEFWRLILDDGQRREIPVSSYAQKGMVTAGKDHLVIRYDSLVSEQGGTYPIRFTVSVEKDGGLLKFSSSVDNRSAGVRVNEVFCPMADFTSLGSDKSQDVLYMPQGPGRRDVNPWAVMEGKTGAYYSHDERETFMNLIYPRASMGWYGLEAGNRFLYMARYDPQMRYCFLSVRHRIHEDNLMFTVDHFPMARPGERLDVPPVVVGLLEGDWRDGARTYRAWAEQTFYTPVEKAPWVKDLTGWQRIIMRSQYGEDYYKPEDLPAMYEAGAKYGIHTLFLFAWWKEGMDRGYPYYEEAYPGAFQDLADNIRKVQEMGGRIILECNCHFLDPSTDYYEKFGKDVVILDINGQEIRKGFVYNGRGEFRETFGHVTFPLVCSGTRRWRDQLLGQLSMMGGFGADCVFADCFGFCPYQPCFNDAHEHGARVDEEWIYHRRFFSDAVDYCQGADKVLGTEGVTDIAGAYCQFLHGNINADFHTKTNAYPALFCYTFPEIIQTERNIYSSEGDFDRQFRNALTMGMRLDAQLWVCRADISKDPKYAEMVGWYTSTMNRWGAYFYDGRFTVLDRTPLPGWVKRTEWLNGDGTRILRILYNASDRPVTACGQVLAPDEMRFDEFDKEDYAY